MGIIQFFSKASDTSKSGVEKSTNNNLERPLTAAAVFQIQSVYSFCVLAVVHLHMENTKMKYT